MDSFEVVVKGRLTESLIRGTCTELIACQNGTSRLLASDFGQLRLHTLLELFGDLNIEIVSINTITPALVAG